MESINDDNSLYLFEADEEERASIWLDAIAAHLDSISNDQAPQRQYVGLDITPAHFPAPHSHPDNFAYDVWNVLNPIPEEPKGKYDLVHIRLLAAAFAKGQVAIVVENLVQLLSPGGWIQLEELDGESWAGRVPSPHVREMSELGIKSIEAKGWEMHVPAAFVKAAEAHANLQNVSETIYNTVKYGAKIRYEVNENIILGPVK
ncbi:hypothetical protein DPV78_001847 [Talaromyces pinophilus]|nr:hypothetical protein DPV78_001847 [Talaromyces pinophilus]